LSNVPDYVAKPTLGASSKSLPFLEFKSPLTAEQIHELKTAPCGEIVPLGAPLEAWSTDLEFHPIDAPTEPGWWWCVHAYHPEPLALRFDDQGFAWIADSAYPLEDMLPGQWYGPKIPEPPQPEKTP
jgi:hypothetical protein